MILSPDPVAIRPVCCRILREISKASSQRKQFSELLAALTGYRGQIGRRISDEASLPAVYCYSCEPKSKTQFYIPSQAEKESYQSSAIRKRSSRYKPSRATSFNGSKGRTRREAAHRWSGHLRAEGGETFKVIPNSTAFKRPDVQRPRGWDSPTTSTSTRTRYLAASTARLISRVMTQSSVEFVVSSLLPPSRSPLPS